MSRWILFFITLAIGMAAGLYYGWVIKPVEAPASTYSSLRDDYKADYVLMVAEAYRADGDLNAAANRLAALGEQNPYAAVSTAVRYALRVGYSPSDLDLMQKLAGALQTGGSVAGTQQP